MNNPNILFTSVGKAEIVDKPVPEPKAGEVRVRLVRSCISSGTERANVRGVPDMGTSIYADCPPDQVTWPRQGGYSSAGVVEAVGTDVTTVKPGDRVALSWSVHARSVVVPESQAYLIPEGISFEHAALAHISTFPMAALRKCRLEIGEPALVMGQGVLGQIAVLLLRAAGATPVIAADPDPAKRERALQLGADFAQDPLSEDFADRVRSLTDNGRRAQGNRIDDAGPKVVIEVTGNGGALNTALDAIAPYGRLALLGCTRDSNFTINYYRKVHARGVTLIGAHTLARPDGESSSGWWTTRDDAQAFLRLLALKRLSLDGFVDEVHSISECGAVYARLAQGGVFPVVQFNWEDCK